MQARLPFSLSLLLPVFLLFAAFAPAIRAQWQTPVYTLRGGWNVIFLHGDATHATPDVLFTNNPEIISVWRWIPNPNPAQLGSSSLLPSATSPEWTVWVRGAPAQTTLASLPGQTAYLIRCSGATTDTTSLTLPQRPLPPRNTWVRNGANLLGFPTRLATTYPSFTNYFATFPAAIAANTTIFKYVGGDVGPDNPLQIFNPATDRVDRHQAYWFDATVVGSFYAPLEIAPSNLDGLTFGRTGALITVRVRNRTAAPVILTIAPATSLPAPVGQETVVAAVPITRRTFNASTASYTDTPIIAAFNGLIANWNNSGSVGSATTRLAPTTVSAQGEKFAVFTVSSAEWISYYNYYPGSLRTGDTNRENNASTPQGSAITLNITSVVTGTNKLTITVDNPHAIQVGDSVTLAGISGSPSALGAKPVTAQPDRTSFEVALTGAAGGYSGGTVTYTPSFNRNRIWAAVHPNHSVRFIVSDR